MKTQTDSMKYEGQCRFCKEDFTKRQIVNHLDVCQKREKKENIRNLRLRIVDSYMRNFWLIAEANKQAVFNDLDKLIRDVWVECCGHLSLFGSYGSEIGKARIIWDTMNPRDTLNYIYDFGSSTELIVEVLGYSKCQLSGKKKIEVVARNYLPMSNCARCEKQATRICSACGEDALALACDECALKYHNEESEKEEHYLLPLANSPRNGVCGYEPTGLLDKLF